MPVCIHAACTRKYSTNILPKGTNRSVILSRARDKKLTAIDFVRHFLHGITRNRARGAHARAHGNACERLARTKFMNFIVYVATFAMNPRRSSKDSSHDDGASDSAGSAEGEN